MNEHVKKVVFISLFIILYSFTGFVSIWHAVGFFSLANPEWLAWILAVVFEIGQATVLFSILATTTRSWLNWFLMIIFTGVQIMGNVYSCYEWLCTQSTEQLRFFAEPILGWLYIPSVQTQTVVISYITGAILPIVALCLTGIVARYISTNQDISNQNKSNINSPEPVNILNKEDIKFNVYKD